MLMLKEDAETLSNIPATEAVLYTIKGGKHALPGGIKAYALSDEPAREISATDVM